MADIAAVIKQIEARFRDKAEQATGLEGKQVEFQLTGAEDTTYVFAVNGGKLSVTTGRADNPDLTVTISRDDFVALTQGQLGAMQAFMSGKLKIKGDMGLAMRLQSLLA